MKSPLSVVKDRFGDKEKLVAAVEKLATDDLWIDRINDEKGLSSVSNAKLIRLHDALETAKKEFGTRTKLIGAVLELEKRTKDTGYQTRLESYALPRLLDAHRSASKRAAKPEQQQPAKKRLARSKKAQAKASQ